MSLKSNYKYLFDTSVFIHVLRGNQSAQKLMSQSQTLGISVGYSILTEYELWVGIYNSSRWTEKQHKILLRPFKRYLINTRITHRAGEMRGKLMRAGVQSGPQLVDCVIAATAEFYGLIVVTDNTNDFTQFGRYSISNVSFQSY